LAVALAEIAMGGPYQEAGFGLDIDLTGYHARLSAIELLFSESQARAVITCAPERAGAVAALAQELGVPAYRAGTVGGSGGALRLHLRDAVVEHAVAALREVYFTAIPRRMGD
jgi:phosphoribosylformylglycinamidine synthase